MLSPSLIANLKSVDPDRYRAALFAPKLERERLMTLYAFHAELAKVPELVSEPMMGQIRYQWWRDCVEEIYAGGAVRAHEVSTPLAHMLREVDIPRLWIDRLIDGRARDIDPQPFQDIEAAQTYCQQTSGVLLQIAAQCLSHDADIPDIQCIGEAWGLTGLARGYGFYTEGMLSRIEFADICGVAQESYSQARHIAMGLDSDLFPAIAYGALIPGYLKKVTSSRHNPVQNVVNYAPLSKQMRLMGAVLRGRI